MDQSDVRSGQRASGHGVGLRRPSGSSTASSVGAHQRISALDGMRAIAIGLVFLNHTGANLFKGGWVGVEVFFVLSGYLITALLLNEHDKKGRVNLSRFYGRRSLRLLPALLVMVVVVTPVNLQWGSGTAMDSVAATFYFSDFWAAFGHASSLLDHTWSLAVEEQFYIVWPVLLIGCLRSRKLWIATILGAVVVVVIGTRIGLSHVGTSGVYFLPTTSIPLLGVGSALAVYLHHYRVAAPMTAFFRCSASGLVALASLVVFTLAVSRYRPWVFDGALLLVALAPAALILHTVSAPASIVSRMLGSGPFAWLGQRSYAFYLWHSPIAYYLFAHGYSPWAVGAITLPAALLLTIASWTLVERRFNALKDVRFGSVGLKPHVRESSFP